VNAAERLPSGQSRVEVETACGGKIVLEGDTPRSTYRGKAVYFCLLECKVKFESDTLNSCLAEQLQMQGD
jgi:YHS domain-containing protein